MKNINTFLIFILTLLFSTLVTAQDDKKPDQLNNLFEDTEYFKSQNSQMYHFDPLKKQFELKKVIPFQNQSGVISKPIQPLILEGMQITDIGLTDQSGTTYHIRIKEPDVSNLAKMPTKKY